MGASTITNALQYAVAAMGAADMEKLFATRIEGSVSAINSLHGQIPQIGLIARMITQKLAGGGTLYTAGNGGSAAQALHLAEELIGRYRSNRAPQRSVCLNADPTALTCIANDFGFDEVFARQCQALITPRDCLLVFSTSGNSANLVKALQAAKAKGGATIGLLGRDGGLCRPLCDLALIPSPLPPSDSAHVQEAHLVVIHLICETIEKMSANPG